MYNILKSNDRCISKLTIPLIWQALFIVSCYLCPEKYFTYTNFLFYLGLIIYFCALGDFKLSSMVENLKSGKKFWIYVLFTIIALIIAFSFGSYIVSLFPNIDQGSMGIKRDTWLNLIIFALSTILFPPLAEELFYRQALIRFDNKIILVITSIISMYLYAIEHSIGVLGIVQFMIVAIPFTISYIKTKNIYVNIAAHFILNLIGNGASVISAAMILLK